MPVKSKKHKILNHKRKKTKKRGGSNINVNPNKSNNYLVIGNQPNQTNHMNPTNHVNPMNPTNHVNHMNHMNEVILSSDKKNLIGISDYAIKNVKLSLDNIETLKTFINQLKYHYTPDRLNILYNIIKIVINLNKRLINNEKSKIKLGLKKLKKKIIKLYKQIYQEQHHDISTETPIKEYSEENSNEKMSVLISQLLQPKV